MVTHADGYAERDAALLMLEQKQEGRSRRITVGADKAYDSRDFVSTVRELNVTPHVTKNDKGRASAPQHFKLNQEFGTVSKPKLLISRRLARNGPQPHTSSGGPLGPAGRAFTGSSGSSSSGLGMGAFTPGFEPSAVVFNVVASG